MASLTSAVQKLEEEISRLKSAQYLEQQKVRLMVNSLGEEVAREGKAREEAAGRAARLQEELEEERRTCRATVQELESQAERAKRERSRALEERQRLALVEEELDVEKRQREEMERRLAREERQAEEQVEQSAKLQDLQLQLNLATKRVSYSVRYVCFSEIFPRTYCLRRNLQNTQSNSGSLRTSLVRTGSFNRQC